MYDESLMNPEFARQELDANIRLLKEMDEFSARMKEECQKIYNMFDQMEREDRSRLTYTISKSQMRHIVATLAGFESHSYAYSSPHHVAISQLRQLLKDGRYRLAGIIPRFRRK